MNKNQQNHERQSTHNLKLKRRMTKNAKSNIEK